MGVAFTFSSKSPYFLILLSYTLTQLIPLPHSLAYLSLHLCSPTLSPHFLYPTLFPHSLSHPPISLTISPTPSPLPPLSPLISFLPCLHSLVLPSLSSLSPPLSLILHYLPSLSSLIINHSFSLPFLPITLLSPFTIPHSHPPLYLFTLLIFYISLSSLSLHSFPSFYILSTLFCLSPLTLSTSLSPSICSPSTPSFSLTYPTLSLSPSPHSSSPLLSPFSPLINLSSLFTCTLSPTSSLFTPLNILSFPPHPPPSLYLYYLSYTLPFPNSFLLTPLTLHPLYLLSQPISLILTPPLFPTLSLLTLPALFLSILLLPFFLPHCPSSCSPTLSSLPPLPLSSSHISPPNSLLLLPLLHLSPFPHSPNSLSLLSHPCIIPPLSLP